MILYHGTSERHAASIIKEGLSGRKYTKMASNFTEHPSHEEMVYLSNCYAPYFAGNTSQDGRWALIEVDVTEENLLPDEDFLEQASRQQRTLKGSLRERTQAFKKDLRGYDHLALDSLKHLGTVAHDGRILPSEIRRAVLFDSSKNAYMALMALDPCISLINHRILGSHYETLTRWFFEPDVTAEALHRMSWPAFDADQRQILAEKVQNREGLELTFCAKE